MKNNKKNKVFTFEDIIFLDDFSLRRVVKEIEEEDLENAFIGAEEQVVAKVLEFMSYLSAKELNQLIKTSGQDVLKSSIELSRERIGNIITSFVGRGRILSPDGWRVPARDGVIRQIEEAIQTGHLDLYNWYCQKNAYSGFEEVVKSAFDSFKDREKELSAITSLKIKGEILYSAELLFSRNSLEHLVISYDNILIPCTLLPASLLKPIGQCKNLKSLVYSTPYLDLPEWIFDLTSLTDLFLGGSHLDGKSITALSERLGNLINLKTLSLNYMDIDCVPDNIVNLERLEYLEISRCRITSLPENIGKLTELKRLDISGTSVANLPESIGSLTKLLKLDISNTLITHLPESIAKLISLRKLDIRDTCIRELPLFLENLYGLSICMYGLDAKIPPALPQNKNITFNREYKIETLPPHDLNLDEFIRAYYMFIQDIYYVNPMARRMGLMELEDFFRDLYEKNDFFGVGMMLVIDGTDPENIRHILSCKIEHENCFLKKKLRKIQMEGILGIQRGDDTIELILYLNNLVDIDGNKVTLLCKDYWQGKQNAFEDLEDIRHELPKEREEVAFIKRATKIHKIAWDNGLLALEAEWNREGYDNNDIFEYGIPLVIDDYLGAHHIESQLNAMIEREHNPWKKKMGQVKKTAVMAILAGDIPRMVEEKLLCYFDDNVLRILKADQAREE
ncbi:MAG: hypothetical protein FWE72_00730 [Spirochaetaceae bacterium]|nr:hypothetical protein [Spirochaetaceae bacterium]